MFAREGSVGNIGGAILRRFKVIFAYSRRSMTLEPNRHFDEPYEYDMSGLQLLDSPEFKTITIDRTLQSSPAAEVGLKPHDKLVLFEGRPISDYLLSRLRNCSEFQIALSPAG